MRARSLARCRAAERRMQIDGSARLGSDGKSVDRPRELAPKRLAHLVKHWLNVTHYYLGIIIIWCSRKSNPRPNRTRPQMECAPRTYVRI